MVVTINDLEEYSNHIDKLYDKVKEGETLSMHELIEIHKFNLYAHSVIINIKTDKMLTIDINKLTREEILVVIRYLDSKKIKNIKIINLLNSSDREMMKLGVELIKKL